MKLSTDQKLAKARAKVKQWETRLRRAANKLAAYRATVTRYERTLTKEIAAQTRPASRAIEVD